MIISAIGRYVILLHLSTTIGLSDSAGFRGTHLNVPNAADDAPSNSNLLAEPLHHRDLETDCAGLYRKAKDCNPDSACQWGGGNVGCIPAPATPGPTTAPPSPNPTNPPTTSSPTPSPTSRPTDAPSVQGAGYCSDDPGKSCFLASECVCGGGRRRLTEEESTLITTTENNNTDRRLQDCSGTRKNTCGTGCTWNQSAKVCESNGPPPTSPPTSPPTTSSPSTSPTTSNPTTSSPTTSPTSGPSQSVSVHCICIVLRLSLIVA